MKLLIWREDEYTFYDFAVDTVYILVRFTFVVGVGYLIINGMLRVLGY